MTQRNAVAERLVKWGKLQSGHTFYIYRHGETDRYLTDIQSMAGNIIDTKDSPGLEYAEAWLTINYGYVPEF